MLGICISSLTLGKRCRLLIIKCFPNAKQRIVCLITAMCYCHGQMSYHVSCQAHC